MVAKGTCNTSVFPVQEILRQTIILGCNKLIVAHNYPSGDSTPSFKDVDTTNRFAKLCSLVDIELMDHLVIGADCTSLAELGLITRESLTVGTYD